MLFAEICEHSAFGPRFSGDLYARDGNVATLRTTDISADGRIEYGTMPLARLDLSKLQQHILRKDDLVVTRSGRVGTTAVFKGFRLPVLPGAFLIRFRLKREVADPRFYRYFFNSPVGQELLISVATGSVQQNLNITSVHGLDIPVPPLPEQRSVAHILGMLDDKIELNRWMNETLEAMARSLFKSWFVDFAPVRDKAEGRDPSLPKHIADLFPDRFVDSELGEIPEGWEIGTLADFASLNPETWSRDTHPGVINYIDLSNTKWGRIEAVAAYPQKDAPSRAQRVLRPRDTIVGTVRPGNGSYAFITEDGLTGSTGFAVLRPRKAEYAEFVYLAATVRDNIESLSHLADGGAYPAVRPEVVAATQVVQANKKVLTGFSKNITPLLQKIAQNERESRILAALRDTLLPKLISGELRVKDAERF
jgi:type I restriction enzyme S subunit